MPYYIRKKKKEVDPSKKTTTKKKSKPNLVAKLDKVFSAYIRLRDVMPSGYFVCISCGQIKPFKKMDCGHFVSRTAMSLRFNEDNCNGECSECNRFSADHLIDYQVNLVRKIGQTRFQLLCAQRNQYKHWADFELEAMIKHYTKEVERLSSMKGIKVNYK